MLREGTMGGWSERDGCVAQRAGHASVRARQRLASFVLVAFGWGVCALALADAGAAQESGSPEGPEANGAAGPLALTRLAGPVVLDGRLDDAGWRDVPALPLTMYLPVFRGAPRERTEIRVAFDDDALWFAGWFHDTDPEGVRVNSLYRDRWNGDDAFAIYVDAFNDNENAKWFGTTPAGIRFDLLVSDDGATLNGSWNGFWEARTLVTADGWFAEVRIPFSTLGFQVDTQGRAVMGLTVTRLVSRLNERVTFPAIDPAFQFRQPSRARDVSVEGVRARRPLHVTPYVLAGREQVAVTADGGYETVADGQREAGADVQVGLTSNLTLDLTVNTDFAQVEADDQQVNLDRFPLFYPEKRRFFQERSGIFEFTTGGGGRLFHSRRIGLTDARVPVPVRGGGRLVGRLGPWDLGLLAMHTGQGDGMAGEAFAVARLRRRVLNDFSTVGLMATSRSGAGPWSGALGVDGTFRLFGDDYLTLKWAASATDAEPAQVDVAGRSVWNARWQRRASRGLAYTLEAARAGERWEPAVGFVPRRDFTTVNVLANWYVFTDDHPLFRRVWPGMLAFSTFRNEDGALESSQYAVWVQWETKGGSGGWLEPKLFHDDVATAFSLGDGAGVPVGAYTYADLQLYLSMSTGRRLRADMDLRAGTFFDGNRVQLVLTPTWNVSRHLELGADYQVSRIRFPARGEGVDIHVARLRVRTALDARASGNAFVQYDSVDDRLDLNVRLRYNFAEGTDLWLVYNEGLATDRPAAPGVPELPRSLARSLIVKYTHTVGF